MEPARRLALWPWRAARGFLEQERRHRLRRIELDGEDATLSHGLARARQVCERSAIGRMRLQVRRQSRLIGGRELAVERADQQRIDVHPVGHCFWSLILRV